MTDDKPATPAAAPDRVGGLLLRWLGKAASVRRVEPWSDSFRLIELEGTDLQQVAWKPGQRIQVPLAGMRLSRTYTPIDWDAAAGRTRFLAFLHGQAPGTDWARMLAPGAGLQLIGPRRSIEQPAGTSPALLFGDETAMGLAAALRASQPGRRWEVLLEAGDVAACRSVVQALGLDDAWLLARRPDESHLVAVETQMALHAGTDAHFVLAGRAPAVQRLQRALRRMNVKFSRVQTKAYWAPGKTGLD